MIGVCLPRTKIVVFSIPQCFAFNVPKTARSKGTIAHVHILISADLSADSNSLLWRFIVSQLIHLHLRCLSTVPLCLSSLASPFRRLRSIHKSRFACSFDFKGEAPPARSLGWISRSCYPSFWPNASPRRHRSTPLFKERKQRLAKLGRLACCRTCRRVHWLACLWS